MSRHKGVSTQAGREIIEALEGLVNSVAAGERVQDKYTVRTVELKLCPRPWKPNEIKTLRKSLEVSQAVFAMIMGVEPKTIQAWEQGRREPKTIANRLLAEVANDIDRWKSVLQEAVIAR